MDLEVDVGLVQAEANAEAETVPRVVEVGDKTSPALFWGCETDSHLDFFLGLRASAAA